MGEYLDLEERDVLVLRVRGDGRKYLVNLRTDNWVVGRGNHDVWQAFLFAPCALNLMECVEQRLSCKLADGPPLSPSTVAGKRRCLHRATLV